MKGWGRFLGQFQRDLKFWLLCVIYLQLFRVFFIFVYRRQIDERNMPLNLVSALFSGFRFDSMVATYWMIIPLVASILCGFIGMERMSERIRGLVASLFIGITVVMSVVTLEFYREFNDQFNYFLFNIYYDDTKAVLETIWSDYHALRNLIAAAVVIAISIPLKNMFLKGGIIKEGFLKENRHSVQIKAAVCVMIFVFLSVAIRGSAGRRPVQRHDAAITPDEFINKTVFNPYIALKYAIKDHREISSSNGIEVYLPDGDVVRATGEFFGVDSPSNIDDAMTKYAKGPKNIPPRHVFVIVMESYDNWPLMDKYSPLGLTGSLKGMAEDGLYVRNFLPSSWGTMSSLASLITGLPDAGVRTNYRSSAMKAYPSSISRSFKELGYVTRFFYGGYLSWQRVSDFVKAQGFDEIYGAPDISAWFSTNEWGVADEYLFDFVSGRISDERPSFNLILSTGYHPPYNVDVYKKGFHLKDIPDDMKPYFDNKNVNLRILGHLWYADRCLGKFVEKTEKKLPLAVFAITGDHSGRKHISAKPDVFEISTVPLVLYGKDVLKGLYLPEGVAGSHIDIGPTLIEISAPKGYKYYSIGSDLLKKRSEFLGFGTNKVIGADFLTDFNAFYEIPGKSLPLNPPDMARLKRFYDSAHGISWWRIKKGLAIKSDGKS